MTNRHGNLQIMQLNINGCSQNTISALNRYINKEQAQVIFLSETKTLSLSDADFDNYQVLLKPNNTNPTQKGGVAILVHNTIPADRVHHLEKDNTNNIFAALTIGKHRMLVCSSYVPPNNLQLLKETEEQINTAVNNLKTMRCSYFAAFGDFNGRHPQWRDHITNKHGEELSKFCTDNNLHIPAFHANKTFLCDTGGSLIDILITDQQTIKLIVNQYVDSEEELFTGAPMRGHIPVWTSLSFLKQIPESKTIYSWSRANWEGFFDHLEHLSASILPDIQHLDPEDIWHSILSNLQECKEMFVPKIQITQHCKPYWTPELSKLSKTVRDARKRFKYRSTYENGDILQIAKENFKSALLKAQTEFIEEKSTNLNTTDGPVFWKSFRKTFYKPERTDIGTMKRDGQLILQDDQKADTFFEQIFQGKHLEGSNFSQQWFQKVTNSQNSGGNKFIEIMARVTAEELIKAINSTKASGKGADGDGIHPYMLKLSGSQFHINLLVLFNKILSTKIWPFTDNNIVVFLRKPGRKDYSDAANYRPITLSSVVGKLFERIIESRLREIVEENNWLDKDQHGFRRGKSTGTYLSQMISTIQHNCSKNFATAGIFVDLQKAFDSIWHDGLLYRLSKLGFNQEFTQLISSFLKDRKLRIKINNYTSDAKPCHIGLPQGSILSPLLFILYIRDMLSEIDGLKLQYADDCSIICWKQNEAQLEDNLRSACKKISEWLSKWRLKANCTKTDLIFFKGQPTQMRISNENINITTETKVLGLIVDQSLKFKHQKDLAKSTLTRKWNMMLPYIRHGLRPQVARTILNTAILPKVLYNAYIWDINEEMSLHTCLKDLLGAPFNPSTETLHKLANTQTIHIRYANDILNLCRLAIEGSTINNILSQEKSTLQKKIRCYIVKLLGRHFTESPLQAADFKKSKVQKLLKEESTRSWATHMRQGHNSEGLLSQLEVTHLDHKPIPMCLPREITGQLCSLMTGQTKLQAFLYKLKQTYTPTCSCLMEDETVFHFINKCPNYRFLRDNIELDTADHMSIISYIEQSGRFGR